MADSLRTLLTRVDATAPAIQSSAAAMMKLYDRSPEVAVVEWRNALHNSTPGQWLPLLYVANEVLQNSKRNRGNKFLEAFSPILGQSLIFVCQHSDAASVEKIRRTVKIWGDRRVFSVRYINELLKGLEPFRNNNNRDGRAAAPVTTTTTAAAAPITTAASASSAVTSSLPSTTEPPTTAATAAATTTSTTTQSTGTPAQAATPSSKEDEAEMKDDDYDDESDDPMDLLMDHNDDDDDDDDDDDIFGGSDAAGGGALKLNVELNFDSTVIQSPAALKRGKFKRRRSSLAASSTGSQSSSAINKKSRRRSILSTTSLVELWKGVADLEQSFDRSVAMLHDIQIPAPETLEALVGDELIQHHKTILKYQQRVAQQRETLYRIANERRALEQDAVRYIPWLETALQQDADDVEFCNKLETSLIQLRHIHPAMRHARDQRVAEDLRFQREQEEKERKQKEEDEAKKFREAALSKETEAKPGMVWNKVTQEYHYLNTDESWRD